MTLSLEWAWVQSSMSKRFTTVAAFVVFLCIAAGAAYVFYLLPRCSVDGWDRYVPAAQVEGPADTAAKAAFLSDSKPVQERYEALFRYFAARALTYLSPQGARMTYPGAGSVNGYQANGLEGFARTGSLLADWVASGRGDVVIDGRRIDLVAFLRRGILAGTDPDSMEYWGRIDDYNVRIVEAADITRILWMTRNEIWNALPEGSKAQVADWLLQVGGAAVRDNNWLLFPVTVATVMRALGRSVAFDDVRLYEAFKSHYLGNGWFYDRPGVVDYYNVWGMTYELFWITLIDQQFDRAFIRQAIQDSARLTAHLIGPQGYPVMGRSICYRTAVPAPLIAQALLEPDPASAGLARRAVDAIWRYFVARGVLRAGALTQGYFRADLKLLDNYSGPGSCH